MSVKKKPGFIDYTWPDRSSTLFTLSLKAFEVEDIQDQPMEVRRLTISIFHWGEWKSLDIEAEYVDWLVQELTARKILFQDCRGVTE